MFGVGDGCCLIFCLVTVLTCKCRLRKTTKGKKGRESEREKWKISYVQVDKIHIIQHWLISNLMHKILIYLHVIHLLKSSICFEPYPAHLEEVYVVIV